MVASNWWDVFLVGLYTIVNDDSNFVVWFWMIFVVLSSFTVGSFCPTDEFSGCFIALSVGRKAKSCRAKLTVVGQEDPVGGVLGFSHWANRWPKQGFRGLEKDRKGNGKGEWHDEDFWKVLGWNVGKSVCLDFRGSAFGFSFGKLNEKWPVTDTLPNLLLWVT